MNYNTEQLRSLIDSVNGLWWVKRENDEFNVYLNESSANIYGVNHEKLGEDHIYGASWEKKYNKLIMMNPSYKEILDTNRERMYTVLNGENDRQKYNGVWLDENDELIHLEHHVFCVDKDDFGNPLIVIGYTINDTIKSFATYMFDSLEERSNQLYKSHEDAVNLAKLLVWSVDYEKDPTGNKILGNDQYKRVLELPQDDNGYHSFTDFITTIFDDNDDKNMLNELLGGFKLLAENKTDELLGLTIKHKSFKTGKTVYLSHNTKIAERYEDGSIKIVGGYITDITEQIETNKKNRRLNDENLFLLRANRLAVQSGKVMIWYLNSEQSSGDEYVYGNDILFEKLGLKRYDSKYFKKSELHDTVMSNDEESEALSKIYYEHTRKVRDNKEDFFYKVLVKHMNLDTKEMFYLEHNFEVEERYENGNLKVRGGFITDVTKETLGKRKIEYLVNHDVMTGLYNRHAFEEYVQTLKRTTKYSMILADIDGLKFINDAFGHLQGDKAIIQFGKTLEFMFKDYGKTYRIGGDEFAIITSIIDETQIIKIMDDVKIEIENIRNQIIGFNFSYGFEINQFGDSKFSDIFTTAENFMYRRKLLERNSRKSSTLDTLLETLNEKTRETKQHCDRLGNYAIKILDGLGYVRTNEIEDMKLLCSVHDIGKITISEELLSAPRRLTDIEFEKVKSHSESGFKIIKNIVNSDDIANGVLFHHERFDGTGYPIGLKGSEIPLYARILSIVDAYDCMVVGRPYKEKMSKTEICDELLRCKGTQFDPKLIDIFITQIKKGS